MGLAVQKFKFMPKSIWRLNLDSAYAPLQRTVFKTSFICYSRWKYERHTVQNIIQCHLVVNKKIVHGNQHGFKCIGILLLHSIQIMLKTADLRGKKILVRLWVSGVMLAIRIWESAICPHLIKMAFCFISTALLCWTTLLLCYTQNNFQHSKTDVKAKMG